MSTIAPALACAVIFVNSFTRRQHLFDNTATPADVDLSYPAPPLPLSNFAQNVFILSVRGSDYLLRISLKSIQCSCDA